MRFLRKWNLYREYTQKITRRLEKICERLKPAINGRGKSLCVYLKLLCGFAGNIIRLMIEAFEIRNKFLRKPAKKAMGVRYLLLNGIQIQGAAEACAAFFKMFGVSFTCETLDLGRVVNKIDCLDDRHNFKDFLFLQAVAFE